MVGVVRLRTMDTGWEAEVIVIRSQLYQRIYYMF